MESQQKECPVDCVNRVKSTVGKGYSILALCATVPSLLVVGCLFSLRVDYECLKANECTTKVQWQGWKGVPLEAIASALGTGVAIYATRDKWAEKIGNFIK